MFSSNGSSHSSTAAAQMRPMYPAATVASTPRSAIETYWCPPYQVYLSLSLISKAIRCLGSSADELSKYNHGLRNDPIFRAGCL